MTARSHSFRHKGSAEKWRIWADAIELNGDGALAEDIRRSLLGDGFEMFTPDDISEEWLELGDTGLWSMEPDIQKEVLLKWLQEWKCGRMLGPWRVLKKHLKCLVTRIDGVDKPVKAIIPQMTVPKPDGSQRVVYNYSARPKGGETYINARVEDEDKHVNFPSIHDVATACLMNTCSGTLDLSDAFRQGEVSWSVARGQIYFIARVKDERGWVYSLTMDKRAAMGRAESAQRFSLVLVGLVRGLECLHPDTWLMQRSKWNAPERWALKKIPVHKQIPSRAKRDGKIANVKKVVHSKAPYLNQAGKAYREFTAGQPVSIAQSVIDDILVGDGGKGTFFCNERIKQIVREGREAGVGWNDLKTKWASELDTVFMGWRLNHIQKTLHMPEKTLVKYIPIARDLIRDGRLSLDTLEKVIGKIEWTATVCRHLRASTPALYWLLQEKGIRGSSGKLVNGELIVTLTKGMRLDIMTWLYAMEHVNSISCWRIMRNADYHPRRRHVWVDAALNAGFGAIDEKSGDWCSELWPWWCKDWDQTTKECLGAYEAAHAC